ncbi:MAG: hypothetical protein ACR2F6_14480 [Mycobacteriales bacterium]
MAPTRAAPQRIPNSVALEGTATGRTIMSPPRGLFSAGGLGGSLPGPRFAAVVSPIVHLTVIGIMAAICVVVLAPRLLRQGAELHIAIARVTAERAPSPDRGQRRAGGVVGHRQLIVRGPGLPPEIDGPGTVSANTAAVARSAG